MSSIVKSIVNPEAILIRFGAVEKNIGSPVVTIKCWWYTYPSQKYESVGKDYPIYEMENK